MTNTPIPNYKTEFQHQTWICRCGQTFPHHYAAVSHAIDSHKRILNGQLSTKNHPGSVGSVERTCGAYEIGGQ